MSAKSPLCAVSDIPEGGAKGIDSNVDGVGEDLILLRRSNCVYAYVNRCPHKGTPLETFPDKFLDQTGELLICSTHGARFRLRDGFCVEGPCDGASLEAVAIKIENGDVFLV